jgi:chromosome segregation ATPase
MSSWYFCLEPDTLEIVDRFEGTEEDVKSRSSQLEFVKLDAGIDPRVVDISRDDSGNVIVQLNEEKKNKINEDVHEFNLIQLRIKRDARLQKSDWTQTNDIGLKNEEEWLAYRQALRDLPSLETPIWPEQPQVKIVQGKNTRTELSDTKADLSETKSVLEADLQTTKEDLQTTQTELADAKTDLEEKTYQIISLEARLAALEQKFISN